MSGAPDPDAGAPPPPPDPLVNLIDRLKADVKVAYAADVIAAAADLKRTDPGRFVELLRDLKAFKHATPKSGFSLTIFNQMIGQKLAETSPVIAEPTDIATRLVEMSLAATHFLNPDDDETYADFVVNDQAMTGPVKGNAYRRWLKTLYYMKTHQAPPTEASKAAIATIESRAFVEQVYHRLFPRIGHYRNDDGDLAICLDRGSPTWEVIEIDHTGWRMLDEPAPVKFIRPEGGVGELPIPEHDGKIDDLEPLLNLRSRRDFIMLIGFILGCYQPIGPFLQLLLLGPHGSAKTSAMKRACALIDPIINDPLAPPREDREILIVAQSTFVQAYDNVKSISQERSAVYCRLSTGGGQRGRTLYTTKDPFGLWARRPLIQTATRMVVKEPDHVDRTVIVGTGTAFEDENEGKRKPEALLNPEFIQAWPKLFGCILDAVVEGLRRQRANEAIPVNLPRMADFAVWTYRCEQGLGWEPGTILNAYRESTLEYAQDVAELDPVAAAVITFMLKQPDGWKGSASMLLALLNHQDGGRPSRSRDWPRDAGDIAVHLSELTGVLFRNNLSVTWRRNGRERSIVMQWLTPARPNGADDGGESVMDDVAKPPTDQGKGQPNHEPPKFLFFPDPPRLVR
jgi:hypothetical protein